MNRFLKDCRKLINQTTSINCLVLGNESCDLDSAVCALSFAFYLQETGYKNCPTIQQYIPLLNITRNNLPFKSEVVHFLKKNNIDLQNILCRDDVNILDFDNYILVDHHVSNLDPNKIKLIIDHRPKDPKAKLAPSCELILKEVGSCATLVGDLALKSFCDIRNIPDDIKSALKLLYGAIVLDTVNFSPEADKVRPLDIEIINKLDIILNITDVNYKTDLFKELNRTRADVSELDSYQILSKDLKIISGPRGVLALPGFPILVQSYSNMKDAEDSVRRFAKENNCNIVVLMGMKVDDLERVERDLAVINFDNSSLESEIINSLTKNENLNLKQTGTFMNSPIFGQSNIKMSRKQILPILKSLIEKEM